MKKMFITFLIVLGPISEISLCQNLGSLQIVMNALGYSINANNDIMSGELFFQINQSNATIINQYSSLSRGTAFGWYDGTSMENWLIGGILTGLQPSAYLPDLDGVFGFNIWTNYNGQERPEMDEHWYSERALNRDGADHLYVYRTEVNGQYVPNSYILAWEDWAYGDWDYEDMVVRVDGVQAVDDNGLPIDPIPGPVPEPSTLLLFGAGLSAFVIRFRRNGPKGNKD